MEHTEQGAEEQTPQPFQQSWGAHEAARNAPESENHRSSHLSGGPERRSRVPAERAQSSFSGVSEARAGQYAPERMLSMLAGMSHALAHAESIDILPLALQELITISGGQGGLALTYPEGADLCRPAVRQNIAEELAEEFAQQPALLKSRSGEVVRLSSAPSSGEQTQKQMAGSAFVASLERAGVRWYLALPLLAQGQIAALLVVVGQREPAYPAGSAILPTAVSLLSALTSAALEQAQLRHLLAAEGRARDEFIGLASHELKSPLTIIKGYSQLLLRQAKRSNGAMVDVNGLEAINQQVTRMSLLVGQLLDVSRIERGKIEVQPQPTDLVALGQRVLEQRQKNLTDGSLHLIAREPSLFALVDPARMEQVFGYLLDNAIKFGQEHGLVEVTIERAPASVLPQALPPAPAETSLEQEIPAISDVALISVRDYGLGVPVDERGRLFKAFYRGPENSPHRQLAGLGLGLYLSADLVARQGGLLWAEFPEVERPGGSLFRMSFPLLAVS